MLAAMTGDDYAALQARVTELERQVRDLLAGKTDGAAHGISLIRADIRSIITALTAQNEIATGHNEVIQQLTKAGEHLTASMAEHGEVLSEILRILNERLAAG